ncbi:hypothetical protein [Pseudomonas sp. GXZC]|uniref:hypothetical protein n=1 Tax=Pseudomonas sp. GXZC TaxID=3003351 RepID=UPI0022A9FF40|nr:hypothetical protein [Pseudomonas sp. GXZC]WAT31261.1 hypothetical protein OZ428_13270 [Pseudomonas sp. GXZC]
MKIELEDVDSPKGCLLRLGDLSMRFNTRQEAQRFVDQLQGRIGAMKFDSAPSREAVQGEVDRASLNLDSTLGEDALE